MVESVAQKICRWSDKAYPVLLCALGITISTSNFMMNLLWVLLSVNWLLGGNWRQRWLAIKSNPLLQAYIVLFILYLFGQIFTSNQSYGWHTVKQMLPVLLVPLVVLTSRPLTTFEFNSLKSHYVGTVAIVSLIGLIRYLTIENLPYRDIVPFISHIRFSLNVCVCLCLLVVESLHGKILWQRILSVVLVVWLFFYLLLQQSYTGFVALAVVAVVAAILSRRRWAVITCIAFLGLMAGTTIYHVRAYYHLNPMYQSMAATTVNGNPYAVGDDYFIESGGYIHQLVCPEELYSEWPRHSQVPLDSIVDNGYNVYSALLRYLNASGLTKDSLGISRLTQDDIVAIEHGVANPAYLSQGSLKKTFGVILYEYETMRHYRCVQDFTMLERFELWKAACLAIAQNPLFGVGTGDVVDVHHRTLETMDSVLVGTQKHVHNQYLTWLLMFGAIGALLLLVMFCRAFWHLRLSSNLVAALYLTIILVSFLTEDTLDTLAGRMFFVFFVCFVQSCNVSVSHTS